MAKILAALPKSAHPVAKAALADIYNAEDKQHALVAVKAFEIDFGAKFPKAVAKVTGEIDTLLAFYDYPAEHWIHLRMTNPSSRPSRLSMADPRHEGPRLASRRRRDGLQLIESAQARWRAVDAPQLVALVRAGARFEKGELIERPDESGGDQQVA